MQFETILLQALRDSGFRYGSVADPLVLSTNFEQQDAKDSASGFYYSRIGNPNRLMLERVIAKIERGETAFAFSSGSAAIMSMIQTLSYGDHIVVSKAVYHGTKSILQTIFSNWGLEFSLVNVDNPSEVAAAFRKETRLLWLESPSNPLLDLCDLRLLSDLARQHGALTVVDNTLATPVLQRPIEFGCDFVVHSLTKFMSGHSDAVGGVIVAARMSEFTEKISKIQAVGGSVPSPFDCWLILRGIRTLPLRVQRSSATAFKVASFLDRHELVEACHYPGLRNHPQHNLACKQMDGGFGAIISFQVVGGRERALDVKKSMKKAIRATSFGGIETLIEHRASIEPIDSGVPNNLLRLSVGLEDPDELVADLDVALRMSAI